MKLRETYTCPLELVHDMIKGKWKPIILWRLRFGKTTLASWNGISKALRRKCCWSTSKN